MPDFLVDAVSTANVDPNVPPSIIDTYALVAGTSKVALVGQTDATQNGVYDYTSAQALVRNAADGAASSMVYPRTFGVKGGSPDNKHSEWGFGNDAAPVLGTDPVNIRRYAWPRVLDASGGLRRNGPDLSVATTGILAGTYSRATFNERGLAVTGQAAEEATTFIEGLRLVWISANSARVEEGACYVPAAGRVIDAPLDIDLAGLFLTANTWYYAYAYESGGALAVEISPQRPASPYRGNARVKGGGVGGVLDNANPDTAPDETRRFLGAMRCGPTGGTLLRFRRSRALVTYVEDEATALRLFSGAANNAARTVRSAAALVPPTSRRALLRISTNGSSGTVYDANEGPTDAVLVAAGRTAFPFVDLDASQQLGQRNLNAGGSTDFGVMGYEEERS